MASNTPGNGPTEGNSDLNEELLSKFVPMSGIQTEHLRELCSHAQFIHLDEGKSLTGNTNRASSIYYLVDGTLTLSGGKAPQETITGGARKARFALIGMEDENRLATADSDCQLLLIERAKVSTLLIFSQSNDRRSTDSDTQSELAALLLQSGLFAHIPPSNIERISELLEPVQVAKNHFVVKQDSEGDYYYIIKEGRCDVLRSGSDGQELHLACLNPGDSFGEEALISNFKRNASIRMSEDGILLRLTRDYFMELISEPLLQAVSHDRAGDLIACGARWLDVRLAEENQHDGLEGAKSIPLTELRNRYQELDPNCSYVTYCNTGRRSQAGAFLLSQRGIPSSYLAAGIAAQRPEARSADAIRQELPELQAQLARVNQELENALQGKAAADAAHELSAQDPARQQVKNDADERYMRLSVEAQKASELLECAKEQKRSLERLVREAQAEAEGQRRRAAAQCEHLRKHARDLLEEEKQRLQQCYESASSQLKSIEQARTDAEAQFETERKRLEEQFETARRQMAVEAEKIRAGLEQAKQNSEQQANRIRKQHTQQEQDLRTQTEAQLREERTRLESEFAETIATQEKARNDLESAETARQEAKREAQRIQVEIDSQSHLQAQQEQEKREENRARLQAAHDDAEARLNQARKRLEIVENKHKVSGPDEAPKQVHVEVRDADKALQDAEHAQREAVKAQQHAEDMVETTRTKEDELRLQLYEEMEEWAAEEEEQSKTDVERALRYAAEMQRIQTAKQEKEQQSQSANEDLFSDLRQALDGSLEADPFNDYLHEQLVAEEKARLIKTAKDTASEKKQQAQQALTSPFNKPS